MPRREPKRYRIAVRPLAEEQLADILDWIEDSSPANALLVEERIIRRIDSLATFPHRFPRVQRPERAGLEVRYFTECSIRVEYVVGALTVTIAFVEHAAREHRTS